MSCITLGMNVKMIRTSVTIPEPLLEQFKKYCQKQRRSVSAQITLLIEQSLSEGETNKE